MYCVGFCMMVTMRSSSSEVISPALRRKDQYDKTFQLAGILRVAGGLRNLPLVQVDIGFLADQVGVSATDALDFSQGVHDLLLSIDVRVEETEDELEVGLLSSNERYENRVSDVFYDMTRCSLLAAKGLGDTYT